MKVTKAILGKYVEVVWRDPVGVQRAPVDKALKGLVGLAKWAERGVADDFTDNILRIIHSAGCEPGSETADEISFTLVHEELILNITVFEPVTPA